MLSFFISFAQQYNLRPGVALSAEQISHLTSDIVWMETQTVSLPDGRVEQVLVPKVYLTHAGGVTVQASGALVTGDGVQINVTENLVNSGGVIDGGNGRTVLVAGADIVNKGGMIGGGAVGLLAGGDVRNESLTVRQDYASGNAVGSYTVLSNQAGIVAREGLTVVAGRDIVDTGGTIGGASVGLQAGRDITFAALQTGSTYRAQSADYTDNSSTVGHKIGQVASTGDLTMIAGQNLALQGTQVAVGASGNAVLAAGGNVTIAAVVDELNVSQDSSRGKNYDKNVQQHQSVTGAVITAGNDVVIQAGTASVGNLAIAGSSVSAGGAVQLAATGDVRITNVMAEQVSDTASHSEHKSTFKKRSETQTDYIASSSVVGSAIAGEAISIRAGQDVVVAGSQVAADNALTLAAGRDVLVSSAGQTNVEQHTSEKKKSGFSLDARQGIGYSKGQDNTAGNSETVTQVGSVLSGGSVSAVAGRDITLTASTAVADHDIAITAGRNLAVLSGQDTSAGASSSSSKKSGSIGSGFQPAIGSVRNAQDGTYDTVKQVGSQIASLGGDVALRAGEKYTQSSSEVKSPAGDISIVAKDVLITAATNLSNNTDHTSYSKTAIGGTISSPMLDAARSVGSMVSNAGKTSDPRMQALAALNVAGSLSSMPTSVAAVTGAGLRVSVSLGNSKSESNVKSVSETVAGSTISAGGDISIVATGAGANSNLTALGSAISAGGNVLLAADNDVSLLAGRNTVSQHSTNKSSGTSIGIGFGIGGTSNGFTVDLAVSQARGKSDGDDIGYTNTQVGATDKVTVISGRDTTLKGGVIAGASVVANIGGDVNIESLQDSSKFDSKQSSSGVNASMCIPPFCYGASTVGGSVSKSKVNGDFLSVLEQSGIKAGDGGFQVTVGGNTGLIGGLLSSSQGAVDGGRNALTTGSLTASELQNRDNFSATGYAFSGSVSGKGSKESDIPDDKKKGMTDEQIKAAGVDGKPGASAGFGSVSGSQSSTTYSGISGGAVVVTDTAKQLATGNDVISLLASVDRTVTTESAAASGNALTKDWDGKALQKEVDARVAITQEFSKQAPKMIGDYADKQMKNLIDAGASQEEIEKWNEGGIYRVALHAASGGLSGGLGGAISSGAVSGSADYLQKLQIASYNSLVEKGLSEDSAQVASQGFLEGVSFAIGTLVSGTNGAGTALASDTNNRQFHWQKYLTELDACHKNPGGSGCSTILKMGGVQNQLMPSMATSTANVVVNKGSEGQITSFTLLGKESNQPLAIMEQKEFDAFRNAPAGWQSLTLYMSPQYSLDMASAMLNIVDGNLGQTIDSGKAVVSSPQYWLDVALGVVGNGISRSVSRSSGVVKPSSVAAGVGVGDNLVAEAKLGGSANGIVGANSTAVDAAANTVRAGSSRPAWLARLDAGNDFNAARSSAYPYNEVYIDSPKGSGYTRLDSYDPVAGEIVSRKFTQLSSVQEQTAFNYINELPAKYPVNGKIANVPTSGSLAGQPLLGQHILEVPVQTNPIPQSVLDAANRAGVLIRDFNGHVH
ncbi:hemagglutinin repeat-containing protein [Duganella phyllosphaerae]|uniref:Filamentous hemagglutinin n=1 Tax=Duganella phyllosphaerae TaxID=762836 RepID=A0A1E7WZA8_9BURK|nr:hemagglutinin repeat-containing protein [Duganella phyllosphaerae]OFA05368.1 hypothetical protein DUPY_14820 [Duganella phyllosphaerae]